MTRRKSLSTWDGSGPIPKGGFVVGKSLYNGPQVEKPKWAVGDRVCRLDRATGKPDEAFGVGVVVKANYQHDLMAAEAVDVKFAGFPGGATAHRVDNLIKAI